MGALLLALAKSIYCLLFFAKFLSKRVKKRKSYDANLVTAKCACINYGSNRNLYLMIESCRKFLQL